MTILVEALNEVDIQVIWIQWLYKSLAVPFLTSDQILPSALGRQYSRVMFATSSPSSPSRATSSRARKILQFQSWFLSIYTSTLGVSPLLKSWHVKVTSRSSARLILSLLFCWITSGMTLQFEMWNKWSYFRSVLIDLVVLCCDTSSNR